LDVFESKGFRFDKGPSLFTLPYLVDELFTLCGEKATDHFEYQQLKTITNYFWEDGISLSTYNDKNKTAKEIEEKLGVNSKDILKYLEQSDKIHKHTSSTFLEKSLHKTATWLTNDVLKAMANLGSLGLNDTLHSFNKNHFSEPKLVQLFDRYATYNGSNPYQTPGIMAVIPSLEFNQGAFFPNKGMRSIVNSLVSLAERQGVRFICNSLVKEIVYNTQRKVTGVKVNNDFIEADTVVSNMDVRPTFQKLLPNITTPKRILKQEPSSSALIFYWGINRKFSELDVHNILFSQDYKKEFNGLFKSKKIFKDPTIYIHISSKINNSDAPENGENWFVMINVPSATPGTEAINIKATKKLIQQKINRILNTKIEEHIVCEEVLTPNDIETKTSSYAGALYGPSSNSKMAAFLRQPNFSSIIKGLYFCGGSVHPGGGIPLCLLSAKIATSLIPEA
jgi:diapolycopene oxygenase